MSTEHAKENVTEAHPREFRCWVMLERTDEDQVHCHDHVIDDGGDYGRYGNFDELYWHLAFAEHYGIVLIDLAVLWCDIIILKIIVT